MRSGLIKRLLFPPKCAACRELIDWYSEARGLCEACLRAWEYEKEDLCSICGERVFRCRCMTEEMRRAKCAGFRKLTFYHRATRDKVQNRVIYTVKESRTETVYDFLAKELLPAVEEIRSECENAELCLSYLPRSRESKRKYGLDQAELLACALERQTGIPTVHALRRIGGTLQKDLSAAARRKNAKLSFALSARADLHGKTVLLVDDIVTTGAGMAAATRLFRMSGARAVYALAVASDDANREMT